MKSNPHKITHRTSILVPAAPEGGFWTKKNLPSTPAPQRRRHARPKATTNIVREGDQAQSWIQKIESQLRADERLFLTEQYMGFRMVMDERIQKFAFKMNLHLVGGAVLDLHLGKAPNDWDFLYTGEVENFVTELEALGFPVRYENTSGTKLLPNSLCGHYQYLKLDLRTGLEEMELGDEFVVDIGVLNGKTLEQHCLSGGYSMKRYLLNMSTARNAELDSLIAFGEHKRALHARCITTVKRPDEAINMDTTLACRGIKNAVRYQEDGFKFDSDTWLAIYRYYRYWTQQAKTPHHCCIDIRELFCCNNSKARQARHKVLTNFALAVNINKLQEKGFLYNSYLYDRCTPTTYGIPRQSHINKVDLRIDVLLSYQRSLPVDKIHHFSPHETELLHHCLEAAREVEDFDEDQRAFLLFLGLRFPLAIKTPQITAPLKTHFGRQFCSLNAFMQRADQKDYDFVTTIQSALIEMVCMRRGSKIPKMEYGKYSAPLAIFKQLIPRDALMPSRTSSKILITTPLVAAQRPEGDQESLVLSS